MEKKLLNTILIKVSLISSILAVVIVILLSITVKEYRNVSKDYQKIMETVCSDITKREQVALRMGHRMGVRDLALRVTSECFHGDPPEVLKNVSKKNIIEFRFRDGKSGHLIFKYWENPLNLNK